MKSIKVLVLTTSFPLSLDSVSGLFVKRLVDNLPDYVEPIVVTPSGNKIENDVDQFKYKVESFRYAPRSLQILAHLPGGIPAALQNNKCVILLIPFFIISMFIKCLIEAKGVDVIHANWSVCGFVAGIVGKICFKPVVTTIRGEDANKTNKSLLFKMLLKASINLSTHTVGVSENIVKKLKTLSVKSESKISCIPNGVSKELLKHKWNSNNISKNEINLISVGNLTENKNTKNIIEAVYRLRNEGKNVNLKIIGDGPLQTKLNKKISELDLSKSVSMHGNVIPEKVYELVSNSSIFVLASFREGRPNVLLESMAIGVPIIASNIDGVRELIKHDVSGLLFEPHDCDGLLNCIHRISEDEGLQNKLRMNSFEYIKSNKLFWDETAKQYFEVYKNAIHNR